MAKILDEEGHEWTVTEVRSHEFGGIGQKPGMGSEFWGSMLILLLMFTSGLLIGLALGWWLS